MEDGHLMLGEEFLPDLFVHSIKPSLNPCSVVDPLMGTGHIETNGTCSLITGVLRPVKMHPDNLLVRVLMEGYTGTVAYPGVG